MIFTATDGTKFEDRAAWRRYEFETNYTFRNKRKESLTKLPGQISGQPFDLSDLEDCTVLLLDQSDQVQIDNLTNCRVFIGPSSESVFVRNCTNCVFTIACKQLRTRDCSACSIYLYSLTDPIIETSQQMLFAPFNGAYCGLERHFTEARLEPANNHWSQVFDFNDPDKTGTNWRFLKKEEEEPAWVVDLEPQVPGASESLGACVNPVARDSGFVQYHESSSTGPSTGGMQSFSFSTTQKDAEMVIQNASATAPPQSLPAAPPAPSVASMPASVTASVTALVPPPAPVASSANQKQTVVEAPEPVTPPQMLPPMVAAVEGPVLCGDGVGNADDTAKQLEPAVDPMVAKVTEMMGMM